MARTTSTPAAPAIDTPAGADDGYNTPETDNTPDGIVARMLERVRRHGVAKKTGARDTLKCRAVVGAPDGVNLSFSAPGVPENLSVTAFAKHFGDGREVKHTIKAEGTSRSVPTVLSGESAAAQYADAVNMPSRE